MVERIPTGIPELDEMISGGFPKSANILVKGPPGAFKTILCLQILHGAAKNKVPGMYLTFNQQIDGIKEQARQFKWEFEGLPVDFVSFDTTKDTDLEGEIINTMKESKAQLVVMDSLTSFLSRPLITRTEYQSDPLIDSMKRFPGIRISEDAFIRAMTARLLRRMGQTGATILFIYEDQTLEGIRVAGEYLVDGVIRLARIESIGKRTISIEKMRYTRHDFLPRSVTLKERGLVIEK